MMDSDHLVHRLEDPAHAVAPYPSFYEGPRLGLDPSNGEHDNLVKSRREHVHYDNDCTLWIGNVDLRISETILFELFSQVGDIRNVSFPNNQGQNQDEASRFCFINFLVPDSVPKAIQIMQGTVLFGRKLFLKCRPGSIHALHSTHQRHQSSKYMPVPELSQLKESPRGNESKQQTSTRWVRKTGADSTSDARGFSPIRAPVPSPESSLSFRASSSSSSSGRRKVVLVRDKYVDSPDRDERNLDTSPSSTQYQFEMDNIARRRVVIKSSSGSSIPVVNINTHTDQKRIKSVVVAAPRIKSVAKPEVSKPLSHVKLEAATGNSVKANTQSEPVHEPKSPRRIQESIQAAPEICYAHPLAQKIVSTQSPAPTIVVNSHPQLPPAPAMTSNQGEQFTSSIEVVQPQPQQFHETMMRPWRPHNNMQFQGHQLHQPRYYYHSEGMRPVFPHYNRHFQFNGGPRHPPNFQRFKHFAPPPIRPYGHSYEHLNNNFGQPNNMGYQEAPFRPRFDSYSYRPRYDNQQYYDNAPQPNLGSPELFHNYSNNDNRDPGMHQRYPDPPVPPRVRSRSRTRSRSKSPYLRNYYREGTPADKSRRMKSRSRTLSPSTERRYKRRSVSRGSSCSYRSSSQRRNEGHRGPKRTRRSRSKSYASSDDNKKARTSRLGRSFSVKPIRRPTTSSSDTSEYSDHGKNKGKSSGELSFSEEEKDNKNDNTTVSSSNHTAKKKVKKVQKVDSVNNNSQQSTKQGKGRKSRFIRTSVSSYRTEGEYDPSDPGY